MNVSNGVNRPRLRFRSNLAIAFVLGTLLAGAVVGRAADGGPRWRQLPLSGGPTWTLAAAPSSPRVVYVSTLAAGVFRSDDGGSHWSSPSAPATELGYGRLSVSPFDPMEVSLCLGQLFYPYFIRSHDGGVTWDRITVGPEGLWVRAIVYDPVDPALQYARTFSGLYRSTDGGRTWRSLAFMGSQVNRLIVDPQNPRRLFALVAPAAAANVYLSEDGGATWVEKLSTEFLDGFRALAVDFAHRKLYVTWGVGLRVSEDDGATWQEPEGSRSLIGVTDLAVTPSGALLVASYYGIERSADQGETFALLQAPDSINQVEVGSNGGAWATGDSGIWRSVDDAATWSRAHRGVAAEVVNGLAASGGPEPTVLAAGKGLFRGTSGGESWTRVPRVSGLGYYNPFFPPYHLAFSPSDSRLAFAVLASGVFRSADGGVTWRKIPPLRIYALGEVSGLRLAFAFDPRDPSTVYFFAGFDGSSDENPRFSVSLYSRDGGVTWRRRASAPELVSAAVDPRRSNVLWGATADGLLRSDDRGVRWRPVASSVPEPRVVVIDRTGALFVGTERSGVWTSRDGGTSFEPLGNGLEGAQISTLIADPNHPGRLFAAVPRLGVFVWDGTGRRWCPLLEGLPVGYYFDGLIALDPSASGGLYAATLGRGVFRLELGDL